MRNFIESVKLQGLRQIYVYFNQQKMQKILPKLNTETIQNSLFMIIPSPIEIVCTSEFCRITYNERDDCENAYESLKSLVKSDKGIYKKVVKRGEKIGKMLFWSKEQRLEEKKRKRFCSPEKKEFMKSFMFSQQLASGVNIENGTAAHEKHSSHSTDDIES